ncbi:cyclic nucleotide-binding domain-containing protein [Leptospira meyeri]|uniref:Ion transport protein n=1 Tax=Leptospira meyeri TaxID=29508 RepID=A0A4R8MVC3_LEPME|nr:cyclic nucleotide-binding domain-containing protein [Leptospira meyeri]EKJ85153.1 transporter, cation channel family protein [Leptospira meyeri serovar Hardjo str. Went 5]EMJ86814.1 transporter, cation channel family protein [Leptospira meyeri serovar Semaranga str. Veldrot Semarang 173]TDY71372.1 ion transport protein [Leptospira meyeri]
MIHPNSPYKRIWDLFVFVCITYFAIEVPVRLVFHYKLSAGVNYFERAIQIVFGIDVILNFNTAILKDRLLIHNRKIVTKTYLRSWFLIDFLSAFPFDLFGGFFFQYFGVTDSLKILRLLRSVRVFELFKSLRLLALGADSDDRFKLVEVINPMTFRLIFFVYWTSLFAHWVACGWIHLGPDFLPDKDITTRYIRALYWSVTTLTTIGYGDITPVTNSQTIYTMGVMILGVGIYGYVIGNIATLLSNLDISRVTFQEKLNTIDSFIKYKKLPPNLANRIRSYYVNLWENKHGIDETEIWNQLPSGIKIDVSMFLHNHLISVVPFFKNAPEELKREVVLELKPSFYMKGDVIFREGDVPHNMYFLSKGHVEVIKENSGELLATLNSGSFFGEMSLIDDSLRTATIRAGSYCDVYTLGKDRFNEILKHHPDFAKHIQGIAEERKRNQSSKSHPKETK